MQSLKQIFSSIPQVTLTPEGVFKYILVDVQHKGETVQFVRGDKACEYHSDNFGKFVKEFEAKKLEVGGEVLSSANTKISCPGGGRVEHSASAKSIFIYGYSQSYGQGDHNQVATIIKQNLGYEDVRVSFEGY